MNPYYDKPKWPNLDWLGHFAMLFTLALPSLCRDAVCRVKLVIANQIHPRGTPRSYNYILYYISKVNSIGPLW